MVVEQFWVLVSGGYMHPRVIKCHGTVNTCHADVCVVVWIPYHNDVRHAMKGIM